MCGSELPKIVTEIKFINSVKIDDQKRIRCYDVISNHHTIGLLEVEGYFMYPKIPSKTSPLAFQPTNEVFTPVG